MTAQIDCPCKKLESAARSEIENEGARNIDMSARRESWLDLLMYQSSSFLRSTGARVNNETFCKDPTFFLNQSPSWDDYPVNDIEDIGKLLENRLEDLKDRREGRENICNNLSVAGSS